MRASIVCLVALTGVALATCENTERGATAPVDDSQVVSELDSLVSAALEESGTPGASVAIVEDSRVIVAHGFGFFRWEDKARFNSETLINVASVSKSITALAALSLVESGQVSLDTPVNSYLKSWKLESDTYNVDEVTVRRLLNHTSGLGMASVPGFATQDSVPSVQNVLSEGVTLERMPGSGWFYSGGGYTLVQLLIEDVTDMPFDDFVETRLFRPMQMTRSTFNPVERVLSGYSETGSPVEVRSYIGASAANLATNANDFAKLIVAYSAIWQGRSEVLPSSVFDEIVNSSVPVVLENVSAAEYGLGHGAHKKGDSSVLLYHTGGNPGFRAWFLVDPAAGHGIFVAVNSDSGVPVIASVRDWWIRRHGSDVPPLY